MEISLDFETRKKALKNMPDPAIGGVEMSNFESAFLCGCLKKYKPKKIIEVGIAAGASTGIILSCLESMNYDYEMASIDVTEKYYRNENYISGFMALDIINNLRNGKHSFYYGYLPEYVDEIGRNIDFVMLDTAHILPGELLDFLVMLPYLKDGSVVCIHDISLNQRIRGADGCIATNLLFSSVTAEKLLIYDENKPDGLDYPNIAAFIVNNDTRKYIDNVFLACIQGWAYMPASKIIKLYSDFYEKYYAADSLKIFQSAYIMNLVRMCPLPYEFMFEGSKLAVYGAGNVGISYVTQIKNLSYELVGWFDINADNIAGYNGIKPQLPEKCDCKAIDYIFIAVGDVEVGKEIYKSLLDKGFEERQIIYSLIGENKRIY